MRKRNASVEGRLATKVPPHYNVEDPNLKWFYKPHTISFLILCGMILIYMAFLRDQSSSASNVKVGLGAGCIVFLVFSMLQMRDGLFIRPHPAFWRVVNGLAVLYMFLLVFMLFQTVDDMRALIQVLDNNLGVPLPERSYAEDCRLYTPDDESDSNFANLMATLDDEFIWAHFFGWWAKALMIRDAKLCWVLSIIFELLELSLQHLLENFKECWWDHIILDILVCNGLGIYMGLKTVRLLEVKEYNWTGAPHQEDEDEKTKKKLKIAQRAKVILPQTDQFDWEIFSTPKRFFSVLCIMAIVMVIELNVFFLKYVLWIPPPHQLVGTRLLLWFLIGLPALRELYQFATDPSCTRLGTMGWLACANGGLEVLVWIKYGKGMFPQEWPKLVIYSWLLAFISLIVFALFRFQKNKKIKQSQEISIVNQSTQRKNLKYKKNHPFSRSSPNFKSFNKSPSTSDIKKEL